MLSKIVHFTKIVPTIEFTNSCSHDDTHTDTVVAQSVNDVNCESRSIKQRAPLQNTTGSIKYFSDDLGKITVTKHDIHLHICRRFKICSLHIQVTQLWQRDQAKVQTFSNNIQRYSQNHAQNCIFGPPYVRIGCRVSALFKSFNAKKLCSRVSSRAASFTGKTAN